MLEVRIAKPCDQAWNAMKGDERVRHCGQCRKNVYDLASLTETEIATLIREKEGRFCARVYRRADGRVLTADCPGRVVVRRRMGVAAAFGLVTALLNAGCMGSTGSPAPGPGAPSADRPSRREATPDRREGRSPGSGRLRPTA